MTQEQPLPFIEENDQTHARREHLAAIRTLIGNAYPNKFARSSVSGGEDTITAIVNDDKIKTLVPQMVEGARPTPEQLEAANAALRELGDVRVSGRLAVPPRVMGKAAFVHLSDGRERLQIYVRKDDARAVSNDTGALIDEAESGWRLFNLLDHGDFVGVEGFLFVTKTGELSVHVRALQFLSKALLPMPDKLHGISDPEIRQRQRYADLIASSLKIERADGELTTREVFEIRSKTITELRRYLDAHGYMEVETPMLTPIASGAAAKPFETFHTALGIKLYARIAPELYLKRLLVGGFEKVYELNRNFRNEGISLRHNPEFTMLEFYCAYMDVNGMMDFCEEMLRTVVEKTTGRVEVTYPVATINVGGSIIAIEDKSLNFSTPFQRLTMKQAIYKYITEPEQVILEDIPQDHWLDDAVYSRAFAMFIRRWKEEVDRVTAGALKHLDKGSKEESRAYVNEEKKKLWLEILEYVSSTSKDTSEEQKAQNLTYIFEEIAEAFIAEPTFITDFPKPVSPLSKASPTDQSIAERFELYVAGMEVANGFSELNDPVEQYARFEEQGRQRERGDEEAMQMDVDYVRALAYGMPPAAGIGIGIDRLVMLLTNRRSIRDVILFPHMRPQRPAEEHTDADEQT